VKLKENGRMSAGKRTRHLDIKYFYISDLIKRKEPEIKYCPTNSMWADYMTKPLVEKDFHSHRQNIMNVN